MESRYLLHAELRLDLEGTPLLEGFPLILLDTASPRTPLGLYLRSVVRDTELLLTLLLLLE